MIRTLLAATLLLTSGCSAATKAESSQEVTQATVDAATPADSHTDAPAAEGPRITGTGYHFNVPAGWGEPDQDIPGFDTDSLAFDLEDDDDFTDNVNVIVSPGESMSVGATEYAAEQELLAANADEVTVNDPKMVAGRQAAHLSAVMSINGREYQIEQYYPMNEAEMVVVTFSFSMSVTPQKRRRVADSTLASWTWSD